MARRPNYGAEKRSKELGKQRKREEKEEKKRLRREAGGPGDDDAGVVTHDGEMEIAPPGAAGNGEGGADAG